MSFLTNSSFGQKRPFKKDERGESFPFKNLNSSSSLGNLRKKINLTPERAPTPDLFENKITEISTAESRDLVISRNSLKTTLENSDKSIQEVYETLGKKLEQENSEIKNLENSLQVSKSEISKISLEFLNFKKESSADFKVSLKFLNSLKEFSTEFGIFKKITKALQELGLKFTQNENSLQKLFKKFKKVSLGNFRILKESKNLKGKLEESERNSKNLQQELQFQENFKEKLQLNFEKLSKEKEQEVVKVKEQLENYFKEFKVEKVEILKECKNELKELKESHLMEKDELKSQISTENLQKRLAQDEILKLKGELQSQVSNLEADITKMDVNLKIKEEKLQDLKEKNDSLNDENAKLKLLKEETNVLVFKFQKDLEKSEVEKNHLASVYQELQCKYADVVTNLESSNSRIFDLNKLVDQASEIILNGLSSDGSDRMDFSGMEVADNGCLEKLINSIAKSDSCRFRMIESLQTQNMELNRELTDSAKKYDQDLQVHTSRTRVLETKLEETSGRLNSAESQVSEFKLKIRDLETKNVSAQVKIIIQNELAKEKSKIDKALETLKKNSQNSADDSSKKFLSEITGLKKELDKIENEKSKLTVELEAVRNGNEASMSEAREKWKDSLFAREAEFKNQLKQKDMIIKEKELLIGKIQQVGTPISSSKTLRADASRISPLKFKSVLKIEEMEDQTLAEISMDESPGFVDESPKMSLKKKPRQTRNAGTARDILPGTNAGKTVPPWNRSKPSKTRRDGKKTGTVQLKRSGSISSYPSVLDENSLFDLH